MTLRSLFFSVFNPILWCIFFGVVSIFFLIEMFVFGIDASIPFSRFICPVCNYVSSAVYGHYRTVLLYSLLGSYAMHVFGKTFKNHIIAFYLGVVTVLGCYGLSEFLYSFPQTLSGYTPIGNFLCDIFYWCLYLFQVLVLYIFTSGEIKATDKVWSGNMRMILALFSLSMMFYFASFLPLFMGLLTDMNILFALNYVHKVILTGAFVMYLRGWKK